MTTWESFGVTLLLAGVTGIIPSASTCGCGMTSFTYPAPDGLRRPRERRPAGEKSGLFRTGLL